MGPRQVQPPAAGRPCCGSRRRGDDAGELAPVPFVPVSKERAVVVVVAALMAVTSGCGFVGDRTTNVAVRDHSTTSSSSVPGSIAGHAPGGGARPNSSASSGGGSATTVVQNGSDPSTSAVDGGQPASGGAAATTGTSIDPVAGPRAVSVCDAVRNFQKAGVTAVEVSSTNPQELPSALNVFRDALRSLLDVVSSDVRARVEPAASSILDDPGGSGSSDSGVLIHDLNTLLTGREQLWETALVALSEACPAAISRAGASQAGQFRLGMSLPADFAKV